MREAIANLQDNTYETPGQQADFSPTQLGENVLKLTLLTGGGASLQLTESFRIGAEVNFILTGDDLLDGQQWNVDNTVRDTQDSRLCMPFKPALERIPVRHSVQCKSFASIE